MIENRIEQYLASDPKSLLSAAAKEIRDLKQKLSEIESRNNIKPGAELVFLLKAARPYGFRLAYFSAEDELRQNADGLISSFEGAFGVTINDSVRKSLMELSVKCTDPKLSC